MRSIYMDFAAATPVSDKVLKAMHPFFTERFHNPSATYLAAQKVAGEIQSAREAVSRLLGARPSEVVFTAGGTEANNLAISGIMQQFPGKQCLISAVEHDSVLNPARQFDFKEVAVHPDGTVDLTHLKSLLTDDTVLVSIQLVNNEIGTIQPLPLVRKVIDEVLEERRNDGNMLPLYLHTDACQAGNYLSLQTSKLGVDLMSINGGKIYGPKQSGALYVRAGIILKPLVFGGGQEFSLRSGTENVPAIIGLATALQDAQKRRLSETSRVEKLQQTFLQGLENIDGVTVNGSKTQRIVNNVHITVAGKDNERLMMQLDERGIECALGSACSASSDEPSHVLQAIGLSDEQARASLRFTMGRTTTQEDVKRVISSLKDLL